MILFFIAVAIGVTAYFAAIHYYQASQAAQRRQAAQQRAAQQQQAAAFERKLCTTLNRLAALHPPPGSVTGNPSRAYLQQLHAVLSELGPDVGCQEGKP